MGTWKGTRDPEGSPTGFPIFTQMSDAGMPVTCFRLTVKSGPALGKELVVMATNFCPDEPTCPKSSQHTNQFGENFHFDIAIPGGGEGRQGRCESQYGSDFHFDLDRHRRPGQGIPSRASCKRLPPELQSGCLIWIDDLHGMDNPDVEWREVHCPEALLEKC